MSQFLQNFINSVDATSITAIVSTSILIISFIVRIIKTPDGAKDIGSILNIFLTIFSKSNTQRPVDSSIKEFILEQTLEKLAESNPTVMEEIATVSKRFKEDNLDMSDLKKFGESLIVKTSVGRRVLSEVDSIISLASKNKKNKKSKKK